jgi:stress-induced-phosphoprotein 1
LIQKLAANPKTASYLADPAFMAKLEQLRQNPRDFSAAFKDPRFITVMGVAMGIDLNVMGGEGAGDAPFGRPKEEEEDVPMPDAPPSPAGKAANPAKQPEPEPAPEPEDEEAVAARKAKEQAEEEKKLGNESYKKRQFDVAIEHYNKAWELHKDITYLTNLSAAQFEKEDYQAAIETCKKAVEEGREMLSDFKLIAKYGVMSPILPTA